MVVGREGPVLAGLEFGGLFDVPHRLSKNKSASYSFPWNRIWNILVQKNINCCHIRPCTK